MQPDVKEMDESRPIEDEGAYRAAMTAVTRRARPPAVLRFIVQAIEGYRAKRKMGWSRPWNKYHMITHQSFRLNFPTDGGFIDAARAVLAAECEAMPDAARTFVEDLLSDPQVMGFVFVHDLTDPAGERFEGVTLGFGRKAPERRFRDRLDLVLEAPVDAGGEAGGVARLSVFVDPYRGQEEKAPLWTSSVEGALTPPTADLFARLSNASWDWAVDAAHVWDHWTSAYIDYFAPREWSLGRSHFLVPGRPEARAEKASELVADGLSG